MVESLITSGIEDHTFGPINLREHFPEEELTLGKACPKWPVSCRLPTPVIKLQLSTSNMTHRPLIRFWWPLGDDS